MRVISHCETGNKGAEVGPRLTQRHIAFNHVHDIDATEKFLDKAVGNHAEGMGYAAKSPSCQRRLADSGSEPGFNELRYLAHIRPPRQTWLYQGHDLAHVRGCLGTAFRNRGTYGRRYFIGTQGLWHIGRQYRHFGFFNSGKFFDGRPLHIG